MAVSDGSRGTRGKQKNRRSRGNERGRGALVATAGLVAALLAIPPAVSNVVTADLDRQTAALKLRATEREALSAERLARLRLDTARARQHSHMCGRSGATRRARRPSALKSASGPARPVRGSAPAGP
jgi:hypothetical protein